MTQNTMTQNTMTEMNTLDNLPQPIQTVRQAYDGKTDRPKPEWVRGICPECGDDLIANCYYVGGRGYLVTWECWSSQGDNPTCAYRKAL